MKISSISLLIVLVNWATYLEAQIGLSISKNTTQTVQVSSGQTAIPVNMYKKLTEKKLTQTVDTQHFETDIHANPVRQLPAVFAVDKMPFFCKIEYKMGLNKKLPVKFRLGDVQYVDELEGK